MIYISTGGHHQWSFMQTIEHLSEAGISAFELSGGQYVADVTERLLHAAKTHSITLHNYFPPPEVPFVFNLASMKSDIVKASIEHARHVIDLSAKVGSKYYSFHAGYLIDPQVDELGKRIAKQRLNDRAEAMALFIERVNELAAYAKARNVKLLIENNVLSMKNYQNFGQNPLLMVEHGETREVLKQTDDNVGLLVDVAHLKVSANTLGFDGVDYLRAFRDDICAYHFSDNQGTEDSNEPIAHDSWFWPHINPELDYYSLEVYNASATQLRQQLDLTSEHLNRDVKS